MRGIICDFLDAIDTSRRNLGISRFIILVMHSGLATGHTDFWHAWAGVGGCMGGGGALHSSFRTKLCDFLPFVLVVLRVHMFYVLIFLKAKHSVFSMVIQNDP